MLCLIVFVLIVCLVAFLFVIVVCFLFVFMLLVFCVLCGVVVIARLCLRLCGVVCFCFV